MKHSREQLSKSLERRTKHLMIQTLSKFEDIFSDLDKTKKSHIFKGDIRNAFNDVMRAQRDELRDYWVSYKPISSEDGKLSFTSTFIDSLKKIVVGFGENDVPFIDFYFLPDKNNVLISFKEEVKCGVIFNVCTKEGNNFDVLKVVGIQDILNSVLDIVDKYIFRPNNYLEWRSKLLYLYSKGVR